MNFLKIVKIGLSARKVIRKGFGRWVAISAVAMLTMTGVLLAQPNSKANRLRILSFRVTANRLSPSTITVPRGRYILKISNGVYSGPTTLDLQRGASERVSSKVQPQGRGRDALEVDLVQGQYTLRLGPNVNWVARITAQ